jgi:CheY-like chemotaxis protein
MTDLILIADGDRVRGARIATTLEAAGHRCSVASQGAAALEIALAEQPRLIVAQADLPLVEAGKLAEILRANPRTRSARFLFLGVDPARTGDLGGVGDEALPVEIETNDIHDAVEALLDRQARIQTLEERAGSEQEFDGSLKELRPAELLQLLNLRRSTGCLSMSPVLPDGSTPEGAIRVDEGEIHSALAGPATGEKALYRMLDWQSGEFHFEPVEISNPAEIKAPTRSVLAEGLRQLEEWNRLAPKLPMVESPVKLRVDRAELPHIVHPLTQEVLGLLEGADRVGDVVDQSQHPDYQVLRTLHTLEERGIVEFGRAILAPPESPSQALFHEAQCRRLRAFAQHGLPRESTPANCKLLIVGADEAITGQFADLIAQVPGAELSPRFERGLVGEAHLESMGRIAVDDDFGIDLIHMPTSESFSPLWPFVGHGALGTIFLLGSQVGVSAESLASVCESLTSRPSARTFHVVMLGEGERLSPDELRNNLTLIDDASLFLLPIEPDKDPSSVLRSFFARIVP